VRMTDAFDEPISTFSGPGGSLPLSKAQQVARQCRDDACRALLGLPTPSPCLPPLLGLEGSTRLLVDTVTTAVLANEPLKDLITIRSLIKKVEKLEAAAKGVSESHREAIAAVAFYDTVCVKNMKEAVSHLNPLPLALWGRSLVYVAEKYFYDSSSHYSRVLEWAMERLTLAIQDPSFKMEKNRIQLIKALEAFGRAHLLRARQGVYCDGSSINVENHLQQSLTLLRQAIRQCERCPSPQIKNRTAHYDLTRASLLHGEIDDARSLLEKAKRLQSLPLPAVFMVEPDFNFVRDADWFKKLGEDEGASGPKGASEDRYDAMKQALIKSGVGTASVADDALRFSLYMGIPQGPLPKEVFDGPVRERAQALRMAAGHQRLKERLATYFLKEKCVVPSDGNCQFAAISDQLYNDFSHAASLRKQAVDWLREHRDWDVGNNSPLYLFVPGDFDDYLREMSRSGTWGGHHTLIALSEVLKVKITVISSVEGDSFITEIVPSTATENSRLLLLSHFAEFHYGSLTYA